MDRETKDKVLKDIMEIIGKFSCCRYEYTLISLSEKYMIMVHELHEYISELLNNETLWLIKGRNRNTNNLCLYLVLPKKKDEKS